MDDNDPYYEDYEPFPAIDPGEISRVWRERITPVENRIFNGYAYQTMHNRPNKFDVFQQLYGGVQTSFPPNLPPGEYSVTQIQDSYLIEDVHNKETKMQTREQLRYASDAMTRQLAETEKKLQWLESFPEDDFEDGSVITFDKSYESEYDYKVNDDEGKWYKYAAIKADGRWYLSGPKNGGITKDWEALVLFMSKGVKQIFWCSTMESIWTSEVEEEEVASDGYE